MSLIPSFHILQILGMMQCKSALTVISLTAVIYCILKIIRSSAKFVEAKQLLHVRNVLARSKGISISLIILKFLTFQTFVKSVVFSFRGECHLRSGLAPLRVLMPSITYKIYS